MSDAPEQSAFFADNTQHGRILLDLGKVALVHKINTYSCHVYNLVEAGCAAHSAPRSHYTLYGYSRRRLAGHGRRSGKPRLEVDQPRQYGRVLHGPSRQKPACATGGLDHGDRRKVGQYRFLLWDVEPTHVDAYPPPLHSVDENTFFGEFDVYAE